MCSKWLGSDAFNQLAEKLGVDPTQACSTIANFLPTVANAASPNGEVQQHDNILGGYGQQLFQVKVKLCSTPYTLITGFWDHNTTAFSDGILDCVP